jgi:hypothetical protein
MDICIDNFIQLFEIDWIMSLMYSKGDDKIYLNFRGHNQQNSIFFQNFSKRFDDVY